MHIRAGIPTSYADLNNLEEFSAHDNLIPGNPFPVVDSSYDTPLNHEGSCYDLNDPDTGKRYQSFFK